MREFRQLCDCMLKLTRHISEIKDQSIEKNSLK